MNTNRRAAITKFVIQYHKIETKTENLKTVAFLTISKILHINNQIRDITKFII